MKSYILKRNQQRWHEATLYVIDTDTNDRQAASRRVLPMVIGNGDGWSRNSSGWAIAMTLLLDWMNGEEKTERKAVTLAWALSNRLSKLGWKWTLSEKQVNDMVCEILVTSAESIREVDEQMIVEEIAGERRDLLRAAALQEATSRLPN